MTMRPISLASTGFALGLAFPAVGAALGASGPILWLLGGVPALLALLGYVTGVRAAAVAEEGRAEILRAARIRRDEAEQAAAELLEHSRELASAATVLGACTEETAARVRGTNDTLSNLFGTATASALTAETVVGLARESERAAARGISVAEQSREALTRLAEEVHALSQLIAGLDGRMRDLLEVADALARVADRSRSLARIARDQSDGGVLAAEALPALVARMEGHVEETAAAAARARTILSGLQGAMSQAVEAAETGSVRAGEGAMVIEGAAGTIRDLARALAVSASSGRAIAEVAQQQEACLETLQDAMNGIFLAHERTAASTLEVAGEARALSDLAARLRRTVRPDS
jgi:methyl-accepting chemotaxis protein